jgi:uncharacterized protein (DUF924 family)
MERIDEIFRFWFGNGADAKAREKLWFSADPEFDRLCTTRFLTDHEKATAGSLDHWQKAARSCLALVLLLDQFPRNMFRNTPRAFASDEKAREVGRHALDCGFDRELPPLQRVFFYMPLEHSEDLTDQKESLRVQRELAEESPDCAGFVKYAEEHYKTIERFGRFPHRNAILGRPSTPQEIAFLAPTQS